MSSRTESVTVPDRLEEAARSQRRSRRSGLRYFFKRFASESPLNVLALAIIVVFLILCIGGEILAPYDPIETSASDRLLSPSWDHPFGTDEVGRDVMSRVMSGAR